MEKQIEKLTIDLHGKLKINEKEPNIVLRSERAVRIIKPIFKQVLQITKDINADPDVYIRLFKNVIPTLYAECIFYASLHNLEINRPVGSAVKEYYEKTQGEIERFFTDESDFLKYYRSGKTDLDQSYFGENPLQHALSIDYHDDVLSNPWSFLAAQCIAYERLLCYIPDMHNVMDENHFKGNGETPVLQWTAGKTDLIELIYAFHAAGVFNHGKTSIREIVRFIEGKLGIVLGNTSMTFQEILRRKDSTAFLERLKVKLELHISRLDEKNFH